MAKRGRNRMWAEVTSPQDGSGAPEATPPVRHCAHCGQSVSATEPASERFGEPFCSEAHAEEFAKDVRAARVQAAVLAPSTAERRPAEAAGGTAPQRDWKAYLGKALCWGAPVLAVVFLLGGGGALAGAASGLLSVLALLACPLGMYFMMRSMSKMGQQADRGDKGEQQ